MQYAICVLKLKIISTRMPHCRAIVLRASRDRQGKKRSKRTLGPCTPVSPHNLSPNTERLMGNDGDDNVTQAFFATAEAKLSWEPRLAISNFLRSIVVTRKGREGSNSSLPFRDVKRPSPNFYT